MSTPTEASRSIVRDARDRLTGSDGRARPEWLLTVAHGPLRLHDMPEEAQAIITARDPFMGLPAGPAPAASTDPIRFGRPGPRSYTTRAWIAAGARALAVASLVMLATAAFFLPVLILVLLVAAVAAPLAITAAALTLWVARDPWSLTTQQHRQVLATTRTVRWSDLPPSETVTGGQALVMVTADVLNQITTSPAWTSPTLDTWAARIDPDEELFAITAASHHLDKVVGADPGQVAGDGTTGLGAYLAARIAGYHARVETIENGIVDRIAHLLEYRQGLTGAEIALHNQALAVTMSPLIDQPDTDDLAIGALTELAGADLRRNTEALADAAAVMDAEMALIHGQKPRSWPSM